MAERKQGPVKPPTIDLTARDATAGAEKPARRTGSRRPAAEAVEPVDERVDPVEAGCVGRRSAGRGRRAAAAADPARAADAA